MRFKDVFLNWYVQTAIKLSCFVLLFNLLEIIILNLVDFIHKIVIPRRDTVLMRRNSIL